MPAPVNPLFPHLPPPVPQLPDHLVRGAMLLPGRDALVRLLPKGQVLAEIGVALGYFTEFALRAAAPARFIAIDSFRLHELESFWGRPPADHFGPLTHIDWFKARFAAEIAAGRMDVLQGDSAEILASLPDNSIDVAYVDADHEYGAVKRDLAALVGKMRPGGAIIMDDYILVEQLHAAHPVGVIYATHEFMIEHGWAMHYLALQTNGFYQVLLRRADQPRPAEAEAALLRASTSWRLTAPLRALRRLLKKGLLF
jgi:hypothetical protein